LDEANIVFIDASRRSILVDDFPTSKVDFDQIFSTTTSSGRLSCTFEIQQSEQNSFYPIKVGVWDLLQKHQVWFKKAPGPVKKTPLTAVGFWMNVHPGFASPRVFYTQIVEDIEEQYANHPGVIGKCQLPTEHSPVELYLSRRKIHAQYPLNNKSQTIDTDALMTYAVKAEAELALIYLTKLSSFNKPISATAPMLIALNAKYTAPAKFGECVARHNAFLNEHRNIAIVGLAPGAMDSPNATVQTLWAFIRALPGMYRCDPCRRTPDLGKWNISCALAHHPDICVWIDKNLVQLWESIADKDQSQRLLPFPFRNDYRRAVAYRRPHPSPWVLLLTPPQWRIISVN
jgi:hypothetical protein